MGRQSKRELDSHRLERTSFVGIVVGTIIYPKYVFSPAIRRAIHDALCCPDAFEHAARRAFRRLTNLFRSCGTPFRFSRLRWDWRLDANLNRKADGLPLEGPSVGLYVPLLEFNHREVVGDNQRFSSSQRTDRE